MKEKHELRWWRQVFSCRFYPDNLPRPETALFGARFVLMVEQSDGSLQRYREKRRGDA